MKANKLNPKTDQTAINERFEKLHYVFKQIIEVLKPLAVPQKGWVKYEISERGIIDLAEYKFKTDLAVLISPDYDTPQETQIEISGESFKYAMPAELIVTYYNKLKKILPKDKGTYPIELVSDKAELITTIEGPAQVAQVARAVKYINPKEYRMSLATVIIKDGRIWASDSHILLNEPTGIKGSVNLCEGAIKHIKKDKTGCKIYRDSELRIKIVNSHGAKIFDYTTYKAFTDTELFTDKKDAKLSVDRKQFAKAVKGIKKQIDKHCNQNISIEVDLKSIALNYTCSENGINTSTKIISESNFIGTVKFNVDLLTRVMEGTEGDTLNFYMTESNGFVRIGDCTIIGAACPHEIKELEKDKPQKQELSKSVTSQKTYDKGAIMRNAWAIYRKGESDIIPITWAEACRYAWNKARNEMSEVCPDTLKWCINSLGKDQLLQMKKERIKEKQNKKANPVPGVMEYISVKIRSLELKKAC